MTDPYRTVALDASWTCGVEVLPAPADPEFGALPDASAAPRLGASVLRGIPFAIGADPGRCFIGLGDGLAPRAAVPLHSSARSIVFAWRLLSSSILDNGPLGVPVIDLVLTYADGTAASESVRDGFHVTSLPAFFGHQPFLATPDGYDSIPARFTGRFDGAGGRMSETATWWPRSYWLWAWANPHPELELARIELVARGPRLIVAGITLCDDDSEPLRLPAARTVRVDVDDGPPASGGRTDLTLHVDRGTATFTYPLPGDAAAAWLEDPLPGQGEPLVERVRSAYCHVQAKPSATVRVTRDDGTEVGRTAWRDIAGGGSIDAGGSRISLIDRARNWVRVEVVDAATGEPVPCRVHFRSPEGVPFPPHGHHPHVGGNQNTWHLDIGGDVRMGNASYAYIDGRCEGWLPRGEVLVDVARGFEYEPLRERATITDGQGELRLALRRIRDMNAERWFSGDTHVHFLSTQGAQLEARGEDLNVVNLLQSQWGHLFTNTEEFTGEPLVSRDGRTIVSANQENRQHTLGHLILLGLKRPVSPWCSGGPDEAEIGGILEATLSDWADACHQQGGTVVIPHLGQPKGETAALIANGAVDGVEMIVGNEFNHGEYYRYLNGGFRLPLVGGTDKMTADIPVGVYRTYVHIPEDEEFTYATWCANLARGRSVMSGGPLLTMRVDGALPGDTLRCRGGGTVEIEAHVQSLFPVHTLQVIVNGEVVDSAADGAGAASLSLRTAVRIDRDSWVAVRTGGPGYFDGTRHRDGWNRLAFAHTSPVYVRTAGEPQPGDAATYRYMLTLLEGSLRYITELSPQDGDGRVTHHHGEPDHLAHLTRPFLAARRRLDELLAAAVDNDVRSGE